MTLNYLCVVLNQSKSCWRCLDTVFKNTFPYPEICQIHPSSQNSTKTGYDIPVLLGWVPADTFISILPC